LRAAKSSVYISTAYFAPNRKFRKLLRVLQARGVDVRILVPEHSDAYAMDWIYLAYARKLIEHGVRFFRYQKTMLHNKTIVVDDSWATVGSANMDVVSFFYNRESNFLITNTEAVAELKNHFLNDLKQSRELTLDDLDELPLWKRGAGIIGQFMQAFLL